MYVFMKSFMNKLVFGWGERGARLQSLFFSPWLSGCSWFRTTGGSVKWGICLSCDFLSSQTDGDCCSLVWRKDKREQESESGRRKDKDFFFWWGGGAESALHITTVHQEEHWKAEKEAGGFTFAAFSPCFTSQLCLDKPHSTCVITTDTVTFSRHKFRHCLGD